MSRSQTSGYDYDSDASMRDASDLNDSGSDYYDSENHYDSDADDDIEYVYPNSFSKLADCHHEQPANAFNPWTDEGGNKALTLGDLDPDDESCMFLPSQSYFHLSCSSRRSQIQRNGLVPYSTALTDDHGPPTGKLFFMCNWFANPCFSDDHDMNAVLSHYKTIACMVRHGCLSKERSGMDLWLVYHTD